MGVSEYADSRPRYLGGANGVDALAVIMVNVLSNWVTRRRTAIPLYAFVPRALWPDKPVILTVRIRPPVRDADRRGLREYPSIGVFHIGDLYASFGGSGVLIGMCVFGLLLRIVYQVFDPVRSPDLGMKFVYIVLLWSIVNGFESDIPTIYGNLLKSLRSGF